MEDFLMALVDIPGPKPQQRHDDSCFSFLGTEKWVLMKMMMMMMMIVILMCATSSLCWASFSAFKMSRSLPPFK
jgi:hypothetical protein